MKQLSQNLRTGKLTVDEVPLPTIQPGKVLVRTGFSIISVGTERTKIETGRKSLLGKALARPDQVRQVIKSFQQTGFKTTYEKVKTRLDMRSPLGYSASGIVLEVGAGVESLKVGDWVACAGADAAHAEVMSVPKNLCVKVPKDVSLDAAAFTTIGAIALQGIRQADLRLGENAVVIGLGLLGQLTLQMLKATGCSVIGFDPDPGRCSLASESGADAVAFAEEDLFRKQVTITEGRGADAVIITAGTTSSRPVELAGELCRDKGRVVVVGAVGLVIPRPPYYEKELDLRLSRSYGPGRYDRNYEDKGIDYPYGFVRWTESRNMQAFLKLVAAGKVDVKALITHRFGLEQAEKAYGLISGSGIEPYLGVLFEYDPSWVISKAPISINPLRKPLEGQLRIGVIGAGNFAQSVLLPRLKENQHVILQSILTTSPLKTRDAAERFGFYNAVSTSNEILGDDSIQAIVIATRHDSHAQFIMESIQAHKAIFVEKPLALCTSELEKIHEAYGASSEASLMVGFNRRFAPLTKSVKQFFLKRQEALVMNYRINAGFIPGDNWVQDPKAGGGRIIGEVCHFIDLCQFLADARVSSVYAKMLPDSGRYSHDNVVITLGLSDESIANIIYIANGDKAVSKEYIEVFGEGRIAILDDFRSLKLFANGKVSEVNQPRQDKGHKAEIDAWVEAVRFGKSEPVPFQDSVSTTKAVFAVLESIQQGKEIAVS